MDVETAAKRSKLIIFDVDFRNLYLSGNISKALLNIPIRLNFRVVLNLLRPTIPTLDVIHPGVVILLSTMDTELIVY